MANNKPEVHEPALFGNWRRPVKTGIGKLTMAQTTGCFIAVGFSALIFFATNIWGGALAALVSFLSVWVVTHKNRFGVSVFEWVKVRILFSRSRKKKSNVFRKAPLRRTSPVFGSPDLPGLLGKIKLTEHVDSYGRDFVMIHHPNRTVAVVFQVTPVGSGLVDDPQIELQVARWGAWLANLSTEIGISYAMVTVESLPDSGQRLQRATSSRVSESAPPVAAEIVERVVDAYGAAAARVRGFVTVVFSPGKMTTRKRNLEQIAKDIGTRLPGLTSGLMGTGAGTVTVLTARELCHIIRCAYDPATEELIEVAVSAGEELELSWGDAGPVSAVAGWDSYRHDSAVSKAWTLVTPPRGFSLAHVLENLLAPSPDVPRKRVTIIYKPIPQDRAPDIVQNDVQDAEANARMNDQPTHRQMVEIQNAHQAAMEEARGAGLVDFSLVAVATCEKEEELEDVAAAMVALSGASKLQLREAFGAEDSAFAMSLPLGIQPIAQKISGSW